MSYVPARIVSGNTWEEITIDLDPIEYIGYNEQNESEPDLEEEELSLEQEEEESNI